MAKIHEITKADLNETFTTVLGSATDRSGERKRLVMNVFPVLGKIVYQVYTGGHDLPDYTGQSLDVAIDFYNNV